MVKNKRAAICAAMLAGLGSIAATGAAQAAPTVNGYINPTDYQYEIPLSLAMVDGGPNSTATTPLTQTAQLYLATDASGDLYVGLNVPESIVDNSYGSNAIGWDSNGNNGHTLNDLLGSDGADVTVNNKSGSTIFSGFMDYVSGGGYGGPGGPAGGGPAGGGPAGGTTSSGSTTFQALTSDGFNANYGNNQDDAQLTTGSLSDVLAAQTSMGYNYSLFKNSAGAAGLFGENGATPNSGYCQMLWMKAIRRPIF